MFVIDNYRIILSEFTVTCDLLLNEMEKLNQESVNNYENGESNIEMHTIGQRHGLDTSMDISMVTETCLMDLNDECLERIFSLKFISITDLCAVARTNHRLMNIANRQFSLNHKTCNIQSLVNKISDAHRVIVTFGFLISDLSIGKEDDSNYGNFSVQWTLEDWTSLLISVTSCCSESLDTLQIDKCFIPKYLTSEFKKLFSNLQKLCINDCVFQGFGDFFVDCKKLVELTVSGENSHNRINALNARFVMDNVFPKLERLDNFGGNCESLKIFLSRHKNLKSLNMLGCDDAFFLLPIIARCRHLEELNIDFTFLSDGAGNYGNVVESLQMLEHLRTLLLYCGGQNITEFIPKLNSLKSLELLDLCDVKADSEFTSALSQLKGLQVLRLIFCRGLVNLNRLADITQLTELSIQSKYNINLDIVSLVKKLNSLKTLNIWVKAYELDKKIYLNLVTVVRNRPIRSQQSLAIGCYIAEDAVVDLQNDRYYRQIVKLEMKDVNVAIKIK